MGNSKLRIKVSVIVIPEEFTHDDPTPEAPERYITLGDDVQFDGVRDFFSKVSQAVTHVFSNVMNRGMLVFVESDPSMPFNKIQAIKLIRQCTGLGLKESKDIIEGSACALGLESNELGYVDDASKVEHIVKAFGRIGLTVKVESRPMSVGCCSVFTHLPT